MRKNITGLIAIFVLCIMFFSTAMAGEKDGFNSINIEDSPLLGHEMKLIEENFGKAKFVKGISSSHEKIFTLEEWDKYAWGLYTTGHYLYRFKRNNNEVQYSVLYAADSSESKFHPTEKAHRIWIIFDRSPTINELSILIPEIKVFNNKKIKTFIQNKSYSDETKILYIANPSESAGFIANAYKGKVDGYGFSIEIILKQKCPNPDELSKVKEVQIDVCGINHIEIHDYQPCNFIKLSKDIL